MSPGNTPDPKGRTWLRLLFAFVVAFDVAAFFQWADGAFQSEFGGHPDEATHYIGGRGAGEAFAHGGIAALKGTPAFDLALGGWMSACGTSRIAVLLFMAALAAATATMIFGTVRREFGDWAAAVASLLWLCAPAVRESYEEILPEQFGAFVLTGAALLWARIMDEGGLRRTAVSRWIGTLAMLGGGCVLAFAFAVSMKVMPGDPRSAWSFLQDSVSVPGIAVAVFAIVGIVIRPKSAGAHGAVWVAMTALVAGVLFARWMKADLPHVRTLIVATPALAMLAVRGAVTFSGIAGSHAAVSVQPRRRALWLFLLLLLALPVDLLSPWQKDWRGFGPAALALIEESRGPAHVLVVSDARGEGMFLSQLAMQDRERKISVERGSETLAESADPALRDTGQRFAEDEKLLAHLAAGHIRYIVLDSTVPFASRAGYHDQVLRVLEANVRSFWPIGVSPIIRDGEPQGHPLRIFRVMQAAGADLP